LVKSEDFTTSVKNPLFGGLGETQSCDGEFRNLGQTNVIGDGANLDNDFRRKIRGVGSLAGNTGEGNRWAVDFREEKTVEDDLVKFGIRPASQEAVEFDKQKKIRVLALWRSTVSFLDVVGRKIDTLSELYEFLASTLK